MTITILVGCDPNGNDAEQQMVLEYSLRKNTTIPYELVWMKLNKDPNSIWYSEEGKGWNTTMWSTPFSGFRWTIPEYCNFEGKAIYCDADFIFLSDLKNLVEQEFQPGKIMMAKGQGNWRFCLTFWNNEEAGKVLPRMRDHWDNPTLHQQLMAYFANNTQHVQPFQGNWNCIDGENLELYNIDALHYSDMRTQFSHKYSVKRIEESGSKHWFDGEIVSHPRQDLQELFDAYYQEALDSGMKISDYSEKNTFGTIDKLSQKGYKSEHFVNI